MKEWTGSAGTLEEAIAKGLKKMDATREQVTVEVLRDTISGLFSMMGFRRVRVKLVRKQGPVRLPERGRGDDRYGRGRDRGRGDRYDDRREGERRGGEEFYIHERSGSGRRWEDQPRGPRGEEREVAGGRDRGERGERGDRQERDRRDFSRREGGRGSSGSENRSGQGGQRPGRDRFDRGPREQRSDQQGGFRPKEQRFDRPQGGQRPQSQGPRREDERPRGPRPQEPRRPFEQEAQGAAPQASSDAGRRERREPFAGPSAEPRRAETAPEAPFAPRPSMGAPSERRRSVTTTPEELLAQWKGLLGWDDLAWEQKSAEGGKPVYALTTSKGDVLAGSDGRTLEAFEYLFNLVLARAPEDRDYLRFLVEGVDLEAKRFQRAIDIAQRAAADVRRSGRMYRLDPMPSPERKAIHQAFADDPDIETVSEGEGPWRKIVLRPKPKAGGSAAPGKARLR